MSFTSARRFHCLVLALIFFFQSQHMLSAKAVIPGFDLEAHRGGRDARPENTLVSFAYALELGVQTLELDLQLTRDGHLVVSHNPFLSPALTRGADGQYVTAMTYDLRTMSLDEIKRFDVGVMNPAAGDYYALHGRTQLPVPGTKIPTLDEVFELVQAYGNTAVTLNIETKSYADPLDPAHAHSPDPAQFVRAIYEVVEKYQMEQRVFLQSFDWRTLEAMHALAPDITLVALCCEQPSWGRVEGCYLKIGEAAPSPWLGGLNINDYHGDYVRAAKDAHADVVSPYWEELSPQLLHEAHALGLKVVPWTVNDPKDMGVLIDLGVDGMISDRPWILRDVLLKRGLAVPAPTVKTDNPYHTGTDIRSADTPKPAQGRDASH